MPNIITKKFKIVNAQNFLNAFSTAGNDTLYLFLSKPAPWNATEDVPTPIDSLELEPNNNSNIHFFIKSHFVNSRIYFDSDVTFDIHLALSLYITKKPKFIYPIRSVEPRFLDSNPDLGSQDLLFFVEMGQNLECHCSRKNKPPA